MCQICKNLRARCLQSLQGVVPRFIPDKFLGAKFFPKKGTTPRRTWHTKKYLKTIWGPWARTSLDKVPVVKVLFIPGPTSSELIPCMCANPEPMFQRYTTKPQTLRFSSHTSVLNFAGTALYIIPHMCAKPQTLRISSHTSLYWTFVE